MKYSVLLLILSMFLLAACTPTTSTTMPTEMENLDHMGCQEGEVGEDGKCYPAKNNNRELFGQDFSGVVSSRDVELGYYVEPVEAGNYPGVVMIHEWWGLNDNIKEMANILASEGYKVLAVDLYEGNVATTSDEARELVMGVRGNPEAAIATMREAQAYLEQEGITTVGSLGWCFGGQQSLQLSLNSDIDATVIYYGQLVDNPEELKNINGPVLGIFGAEDGSIPVESVQSFEAGLNEVGIENSINIYDGVGHAFANPSGSGYAPEQTLDAWDKTVDFLNENLKG